jgi:hypothetical protein
MAELLIHKSLLMWGIDNTIVLLSHEMVGAGSGIKIWALLAMRHLQALSALTRKIVHVE